MPLPVLGGDCHGGFSSGCPFPRRVLVSRGPTFPATAVPAWRAPITNKHKQPLDPTAYIQYCPTLFTSCLGAQESIGGKKILSMYLSSLLSILSLQKHRILEKTVQYSSQRRRRHTKPAPSLSSLNSLKAVTCQIRVNCTVCRDAPLEF